MDNKDEDNIIGVSENDDIDNIYDADLSSEDSGWYRYCQTEEFVNMRATLWFSNLNIYPTTRAELDFFVNLMDLLNFFTEFDYEASVNFSTKRLDLLYILLRLINKHAVDFCEHTIKNFFEKEFNKIFYEDATRIDPLVTPSKGVSQSPETDAFLDEFYVDMAEFILRLITPSDGLIPEELLINDVQYVPDEVIIKKISERLVRYCRRILNSAYYTDILEVFKIELGNEFFIEHTNVFNNITERILDYLFKTTKPIIAQINRFVLQFSDPNVPDDILFSEISKFTDPDELSNEFSDPISYYESTMMDNPTQKELCSQNILIQIHQYDNFLYPYERKMESRKYAFWVDQDDSTETYTNISSSGQRERTASNALKYGLLLYPEKSMSDILTPFVYHKFVSDTKELIVSMVAFMEEQRHTPGIFNKYDVIDLQTAFMLIAMSNDIKQTYDSFLSELKTKADLPFEYPIEFVLRLISRITNVDIKFYDMNMECTQIDNSIYKIYHDSVIIHQASFMEYYILYPNGTEFMPINDNKLIPAKPRTKKKKVNIVEI